MKLARLLLQAAILPILGIGLALVRIGAFIAWCVAIFLRGGSRERNSIRCHAAARAHLRLA